MSDRSGDDTRDTRADSLEAFDKAPERDPVFLDLASHVRLQDKPVIESQRPWLIPPFWTRMELPVGPGDLPLMEYQKWLEDLGIVTAI